jgi:hypothetical protein
VAVGFVEELLAMVNCPLAEPVAVGANCRFRLSAWPGFKVTGNEDPDTEKPVPDASAEFTVTAAVPLEVKVTVCVAWVFTVTLPNATLVALMLRVGIAGESCRAKVLDTPPAAAVSVTVCAVLNEDTVAAKGALVAPAATVTALGTVTALLLSETLTLIPPLGAAPVSVGVQVTLPGPVIVPLLQENVLNTGAVAVPVPLRLTPAVGFEDELLETVSCPVAEPAAVGLNCRLNVTACPGFNVTGKALPETENPWPEIAAEFTVTAAVPVDWSVRDCVADEFTATFPKARLVELMPRVGVVAAVGLNWMA